MHRTKKLSCIVFFFCISFAWFPFDPAFPLVNLPKVSDAGDDAILWKFSGGVLGSPWSSDPQNWTFTINGDEFIALSTDAGLAVIDLQGGLNWSYATTGPVFHAVLANDLDSDGAKDVILVVDDQGHPNIIAISYHTSQELWYFSPTVRAIDPATYEIDAMPTQSWDAICVGDLDEDGVEDLCVSSWYQVFLLSGKTGAVLWSSEQRFGNDVWKLVLIPNYDLSGDALILGGSEDGLLVAIDLKTGSDRWVFRTSPSVAYYREGAQIKSITVPNSVDDLCIVPDVDMDGVADLLATTEDGFVRLFSGDAGTIVDSNQIFQVGLNPSTDPLEIVPDTSPFTASDRLYKQFGFKIQVAPDVNGDGLAEYFLTARNLYRYQDICNEIYLISVTNTISVLESFHLNQGPNQMSYSISCVKNGLGVPVYFALTSPGIYSASVLYNGSSLAELQNSIAWSESSSESISADELAPKGYLLPIDDLTGDAVSELFIATQRGLFGVFDSVASQILWSRTVYSRTTSMLPVADLNGDGKPDLLFKHLGRSQIAWDPFVDKDIIVDLVAVNTNNGSVLWRFSMPDSAIYDGLQDIEDVGDVTGDAVTDFVAWIAPARIPPEVPEYFNRLGGSGVISLSSSTKTYYRSKMANYSRLMLIDGRTGALLWDPPLSSMLYRFTRSTSYTGTYENPSSQTPGTYKITNRAPRPAPAGWFSSASTYLYTLTWNRPWNITDLYIPDALEISTGSVTGGSVESLGGSDENLTIATDIDGSQWSAVFNITIPTNMSSVKSLGAGEFPLSERERLSALKFQTRVSLNATPIAASMTYSLFNFSAGDWVLCNWTDANKIWDSRYPDLHGDYNSSGAEGGYRSSYANFTFAQGILRSDVMYVVARGTADADPAVEFDYENASTLSAFIDSAGSIKLRINVTDTQPLNVTFNTLGLMPFSWGVAPPHFDAAYMYDTLENAGASSFQDDYLLELDVQSFDVINGTGDSHLDVVLVIGPEFMEFYPTTIGSRLILVDLYDRTTYTRWGTNRSIFPTFFARLLPLNDSLNAFILSGRLKNATGSYGTAHAFMGDPHWDHIISQFDNYTTSYANMDFRWIYSDPSFRFSWSGVGKVILNNTGRLGIIAGDYGPGPVLENLSILDLDSLTVINDIPVSNLFKWSSDAGIDFELPGIGYVLQLGRNDFNHDGWNDHVGLYRPAAGSGLTYNDFVVFSGNPLDKGSDRIMFNCTTHTSLVGYDPSDTDLTLPFAVPGDINNDGILDICVGIDAKQTVCRGANISYFNAGVTQTSVSQWSLEPTVCTTSFAAFDLAMSLAPAKDFTGDGHIEFLLNRNQFLERSGAQASEPAHIAEILDLFGKRVVFRFSLPVQGFKEMTDINGDAVNDFCILTENSILCVNSRFNVNFTNINQDQTMPAGRFSVEWSASITNVKFELRVDGISHGFTLNKTMLLSLGAGRHDLQIQMYDSSNIVVAMDSVSVFVPAEYDLVILVGVVLGGIIALYAFWQHRRKQAWHSAQNTLKRRRKSNG